jgi:hypothetical protein
MWTARKRLINLFKLLSVNKFSVYFDTNAKKLLQSVDDNSVIDTMRSLIDEKSKDAISVTIKVKFIFAEGFLWTFSRSGFVLNYIGHSKHHKDH